VEHKDALPKLTLFPHTAGVNGQGHLTVGGCDTIELAATYGTPLYIFDETTIRAKCSEYRREFGQRYSDTLAIYACKAFTSQALIRLLHEEGFGLDVVSGGELHVARSAGFPLDRSISMGTIRENVTSSRHWNGALAASWWTTSMNWRCLAGWPLG